MTFSSHMINSRAVTSTQLLTSGPVIFSVLLIATLCYVKTLLREKNEIKQSYSQFTGSYTLEIQKNLQITRNETDFGQYPKNLLYLYILVTND